jgi:putative membrane protein
MDHAIRHSALRALTFAFGIALAPAAFAHSPETAARGAEASIAGALIVTAGLYALGTYNLGQGTATRGRLSLRAVFFASSWIVLALTLVFPLPDVTRAIFSAHMIQHELLMVVAAPLIVLSRPLAIWAWALPRAWRARSAAPFKNAAFRRFWDFLSAPLIAALVHAIAIWIWHVPALFEAAEAHVAIHGFQHSLFFSTALLFWWSVLKPGNGSARAAAVLSLFVTMLHTSALGVLLTFSPEVWYPASTSAAVHWSLTPLEDQQLGGLIMWIPGSAGYVIAALALAARWLTAHPSERLSV